MPDPDTMMQAVCVHVVDGDTAWFEEGDYATHKVRFIGIDTPETVHPAKEVQPYGEEASAFTTEALLGETVYLESDVEEVDRYNRFLFYVWLEDGTLFNWTLVRQGYATVTTYPPNVKYVEHFTKAQELAREEGLGLWASSAFETMDYEEVEP